MSRIVRIRYHRFWRRENDFRLGRGFYRDGVMATKAQKIGVRILFRQVADQIKPDVLLMGNLGDQPQRRKDVNREVFASIRPHSVQ